MQWAGRAYEVPFLVCGDGGHNVTSLVQARLGSPAQEPADGSDVSYLDPRPFVNATGLVLNHTDDQTYGYLRVSVDALQLRIEFHPVGPGGAGATSSDGVTVELASHSVVPSTPAPASRGAVARRGTKAARPSGRPSAKSRR